MGIKTRIFIIFCIAIIMLSAGLALFSGIRLRQPAYAARSLPDSDLSVVGPPSLPASTVDAIFSRLGSPMAGTGRLVEQTSRQVNIDDAFALGVWWTETNDGAAGVGLADRNPGSVRGSIGYPSAYDGYTIYPNYADAIVYWFHMLKNIYIGHGLTTVYAISHPYVGTSTSYLWAGKVVALMMRYRGEAPPPTPSPTITVSPTVPAFKRQRILPGHTGATTAQSSMSSVTGQQAVHPAVPVPQQAQKQIVVLSVTATWLIAIFALLLALAIALYVQLLSTSMFASRRRMLSHTRPASVSFSAPSTDALNLPAFQSPVFRLPSRLLEEPRTDALAKLAPATPSAFLPATSKFRRTRLTPAIPASNQPEEVPVLAERRPTGLLARYGNSYEQTSDLSF